MIQLVRLHGHTLQSLNVEGGFIRQRNIQWIDEQQNMFSAILKNLVFPVRRENRSQYVSANYEKLRIEGFSWVSFNVALSSRIIILSYFPTALPAISSPLWIKNLACFDKHLFKRSTKMTFQGWASVDSRFWLVVQKGSRTK